MFDIVKKVGLFVFETLKVVVISLAIILPVRYFLIQPFYVEGQSMEPSFHEHEYLIIDEISYRLRSPKRGDVVVFRNPRNPRDFFIKRVIGLPGESLKVIDGQIFINDKLLREEYLDEVNISKDTKPEVTIGPDELFLMGDNRANSLDSRVIGPVNERFLIGRVWIRGWPLTRVSVFDAPLYSLK